MIKVYQKTLNLVDSIFAQGDSRYYDNRDSLYLAYFIENNGIIIEETHIPCIFDPPKDEINSIWGPQKNYKYLGKKLLEKKKYSIIGFEIPFRGGRTDILAKSRDLRETIAVECCSCRISKGIEYLEEKNTILWRISLGNNIGLPGEKLPLFIIKRGPNWKKCLKAYNDDKNNMLRNVTSPLDRL